jgi:hypothetical protein
MLAKKGPGISLRPFLRRVLMHNIRHDMAVRKSAAGTIEWSRYGWSDIFPIEALED